MVYINIIMIVQKMNEILDNVEKVLKFGFINLLLSIWTCPQFMLKIGILRNPTHEWGIIADEGINEGNTHEWGNLGTIVSIKQLWNIKWQVVCSVVGRNCSYFSIVHASTCNYTMRMIQSVTVPL